MPFKTEIDPNNWLEDNRESAQPSKLGISDEIYNELKIEEEFGEGFHQLNYEIETKKNDFNGEIESPENIDLNPEDGFFYNVEIRELVDENLGKKSRHEINDGLLGVHFTGYRDENGNDYICHSDPKKWTEDGVEKYPDFEGEPNIEKGLKQTENYFSVEETYEMEEGLQKIETYLTEIAEKEEGNISKRWLGVRDAVAGFRKTLAEEKPSKIYRENINYGN